MADFGFGAEIGRDEDANRWALATADVVAEPGDWAATPVAGQRAVTIAAGQGQAAQITMPGGVGAKTEPEVIALAQPSAMTYAGKLICREIEWFEMDSEVPGASQFVVLDAGDFASWPTAPPLLESVAGFTRQPGAKYHVPLYFAAVHQTSNEVRLWDFRKFAPQPEARDTGWVAVPPSVPASYTSQASVYRLGGEVVYARGTFSKTTGNVAAGDLLAVFPPGHRPQLDKHFLSLGSGQSVCKLVLNALGELRVNSAPTAATTSVTLDTMPPFIVAGA